MSKTGLDKLLTLSRKITGPKILLTLPNKIIASNLEYLINNKKFSAQILKTNSYQS